MRERDIEKERGETKERKNEREREKVTTIKNNQPDIHHGIAGCEGK